MSDKCAFKKNNNNNKGKKKRRKKKKEKNIKAFHKLALRWKGGNYAILNSEAICKGKDQETWEGCSGG